MPNSVKRFTIKQKTALGDLILHPETEIAQIVDFESGVNSLIANAAFPRFGLVVVNELPTGDDIRYDKIYLVTGNSADNDEGNVFTEYVRVGNNWEILGEQRSALPVATRTNIGVVRIGDNINVDNGLISVNTATTSAKGVVQIGNNIDVDAGVISVKKGSTSDFGILKVGDNIDVANSIISVKKGSTSDFGILKVGDNIDVSSSVISVKKGDASNYGLLKVGTNIDVNDSTISVKTGSTTDKGVLQVGDNIDVASGVISVKKASTTDFGVVKVGTNIDVGTGADSGVISVKTGSTTDKGVLQVGTNIDVASGVISVKDGSTTDKGVLQVGDYLNVSNGVVNADVATDSAKGVVQVGDYLTVTSGVVSADVATDSAKGVIQGGDRVTITTGILSADKQYEVIDNSNNGSNYPTDLANGFIWFEITGDGTDGLTASTLVLTVPSKSTQGSAVTATATVSPNTASGVCKFILDGDTSNATNITITNGTAARTYTNLPAGIHTIKCIYSGDDDYRSDTNTISGIIVNAPDSNVGIKIYDYVSGVTIDNSHINIPIPVNSSDTINCEIRTKLTLNDTKIDILTPTALTSEYPNIKLWVNILGASASVNIDTSKTEFKSILKTSSGTLSMRTYDNVDSASSTAPTEFSVTASTLTIIGLGETADNIVVPINIYMYNNNS